MEFNTEVRESAVVVAVVDFPGMRAFAVIGAADVWQTACNHHAICGRVGDGKADTPGAHVAHVISSPSGR